MDLLPAIEAYIERHQLLPYAHAPVVVGVSGGPDSVALLHLLHRLAEQQDFALHVAHLHHGIRGAEADADADFVAAFARQLALPCTIERVDLPALAAAEGLALEEAARRVRYAFFARLAQRLEAPVIAVGHNADDQAETVLMHLLRGAGLSGLRGMLPATPLCDYRLLPLSDPLPSSLLLIRPLLATPRAAIKAYCATYNLETRFDRSNLDTTFFRNRLRHEVLPYLAELNPGIATRLQHLAEVVRADYEILRECVDVAWDALLIEQRPDALIFNLDGWRMQHLAIRRALVRRAAYHLRSTLRDVDFTHIAEAIRVAQQGETGAQATLPRGLALVVEYETLRIGATDAVHLPRERPWLSPDAELALNIPGQTPLEDGWVVTAQLLETWDMDAIVANADALTAWLDADVVGATPVLRTRREGDRFAPQGMAGRTVRLSDFLINVKLPQPRRDYLPLLVANEQLLWVVGERLSEAALVRPHTRRVLRLHFDSLIC